MAGVLFGDYQYRNGLGAGKQYPLLSFLNAGGLVAQPGIFEAIQGDNWCLKYVNKELARRRGGVIPPDFENP
jgi:hypothetical protein